MKLSHLFNSLPKRVAAGALIALAFALPAAVSAADMVQIEANTGVANATAGDTSFGTSTSATYGQVVEFEVTYNNDEVAGSGKTANNLRVHFSIPSTAGTSQTVTTTTSSDNSNTVNGSVQVNLNRSDAFLQYIPGTAVWKHAVSANSNQTTQQTVSDNVVLNSNGLVLENENPCQAGSVTVEARVMVPGVSVDKFVRLKGDHNWVTSITANPGDTVQYEIVYKNTGNTDENNVVVRDTLPSGMTLVAGTTNLANATNPNGVLYTSDAVAGNGIVIGNYSPGANAFVMFDAKVPAADKLVCGDNQLRNVGMVQPEGMNFYYNTADVNVNKACANTPSFTCDAFHVTPGDHVVKVDSFSTSQSNGATFKNVVINWGDNSAPLTTNNAVGQTHQYKDGTFVISATAHFTVNGQDVTATGSCNQTVTFTTPATPTTPVLPNTGAGNVIGIFGAVTIAGAFAHRLFLGRRLAR